VYGIACSAFSKTALLRMFEIKGRSENKPPVVLISNISELEKFSAKITNKHIELINKYWPGPLTIIFDISLEFKYLDKGLGLAIRLPNDQKIINILMETGALATSSANHAGESPAKNITEAQEYFHDQVDFYENGGNLDSLPSTLVRVKDDKIEIIREGVVKLN
jgi:L-threonylcarbamoyladenylate synthase